MTKKTVVVAIGGNALLRRGEPLEAEIQRKNIATAAQAIAEIAKEYNVHPEQITQWKSELLDNGSNLFNSKSEKNSSVDQKEVDSLYKTIGQQTTELNFLKKNLGMSTDWKD